jgi:hypothetical protein
MGIGEPGTPPIAPAVACDLQADGQADSPTADRTRGSHHPPPHSTIGPDFVVHCAARRNLGFESIWVIDHARIMSTTRPTQDDRAHTDPRRSEHARS